MSRIARPVVAALLVLAAPAVAAPPTDAEIGAAIKQLGDERFAVREKAMKVLAQAGPAAEKQLTDALGDPNPEVVKRARNLLDRIIYRIEPGAPPEIVAMAERYKHGTADEQSTILKGLLKMGSKSHVYLIRWLIAVDDTRQRALLDQFAFDDWKVLVPLMADEQEKIVAELLDRATAAGIESAVPHYAALQFLSGRMDESIVKLRADVTASGGQYKARMLAALCRLKGDWDGVAWAAERAGASDLVRLALMEQGKWGELLSRYTPEPNKGLSEINGLGLLMAYHRLAGNERFVNETAKRIAEYAGGPNRNNQPLYAAKALMINERTQEAIDLYVKHEHWQDAAELLAAQNKYREALALSERAAVAERQPDFMARYRHVNLLHRVGDVPRGREWLDKLTKDMAQATVGSWPERQIELEYRLGLVESAEKRLLGLVEQHGTSYLGHAFEAVFPQLGERADTLWRLLRYQSPNERADDTLKRLRQIEDRTVAADALAAVLRTAAPSSEWMPRNSSPSAFDHLAWVVAWYERADLAAGLLLQSGWKDTPASALLYLADTLAAAGKWQAAADAYRKIWDADRTAPLPYFLHGWALTKLGKAAEGKSAMEAAHRLPLGGDSARYYFHEALMERGFVDDARREVAIRARLSPPSTWYHGQAMDHAARAAHQSGDYAAAAAIHERNLLRLLPTSSGYRSSGGYMRMTGLIHALRAKALLAAGKKDEAFRELDRARQMHPTHLETPILLVADLEKAGEADRAGKLFNEIYTALEQASREYPACADAHNQLAWLSARCRRRLDEALIHSQKAVELSPLVPSYRDTLAEVYFQRGDTAKAIELMKTCLKMPSANVGFYRQQLARFEKGDPKSEPAEE